MAVADQAAQDDVEKVCGAAWFPFNFSTRAHCLASTAHQRDAENAVASIFVLPHVAVSHASRDSTNADAHGVRSSRASPRRPGLEGDADRGSRPRRPLEPPTQEELAVQKRRRGPRAARVRQSLKKYLRRKREALKPKVEAAKKCAVELVGGFRRGY